MKHIIQIEDNSRVAKSLLAYLMSLSQREDYLSFLSQEELEEEEEKILLDEMITGKQGGLADKDTVLKKLDIICK